KNVQRSRRVIGEAPKQEPQATPPTEAPQAERTPSETPVAEPTAAESPKTEPVATDSPKTEPAAAESPKTEDNPPASASKTTKPRRKKPSAAKTNTPVTKKTAAEIAEQDLDESEEVELTLTKPLPERADKLKEFLDTHPDSKARPRATELLISTHAALGDQFLKADDVAKGIENMMLAIDEAEVGISDKLFGGVIAQIPSNLILRVQVDAAFEAATKIEKKFGSDPKRLLSLATFYVGIERGDEAQRIGEQVVKLAPDLAEAHRVLAVSHHIDLELDEAAAEYKKT